MEHDSLSEIWVLSLFQKDMCTFFQSSLVSRVDWFQVQFFFSHISVIDTVIYFLAHEAVEQIVVSQIPHAD